MKRTSIIWYILGAIVLIGLGFMVGFAINGGFMHMAAGPGGFRGGMMPGMLMGGLRFGLGRLFMLIFLLGPLAGIAALVIVLTRRPVVVAAPAAAAPIAATPESAETAAASETAPARTRKK